MSWQGHVDKLVATKQIIGAIILGHEGKIYACSPSLKIVPHEVSISTEDGGSQKVQVDEAKVLVEAGLNGGELKGPGGVWINNKKYHLIDWRKDDKSNVGYYKCVNGGATIAKTNKCVIVGVWMTDESNKQSGGNCNKLIEKLAEDFIKVKY